MKGRPECEEEKQEEMGGWDGKAKHKGLTSDAVSSKS